MSLRFKIMAGTAGTILLFGSVVLANIHHGLTGVLEHELTRRGATIADTLLGPGESYLLTENAFALHQLIETARRSFDDVRYIFVQDERGGIVTHTFPTGFPKKLDKANRLGPGEGSRSRLIDTEEGLIRDIAVSFPLEGLGSIHVGLTQHALGGRILRVTGGWGIVAMAILCLGAGLIYRMTDRISRRLNRLVRITEEVGRGNLDVRVQESSRDELGRLARAFDSMTGDLKEYQAQAVRAGQLAAIGELASCVAHEINNPMNTMAVCSQALLDRARSEELLRSKDFADFPEYLETINNEISRCKKITTDLLLLAHPRPPHRVPTDIRQVVLDALTLLSYRFEEARVVVRKELAADLPEIKADPAQLKQVLLNIIGNALDHTDPGGGILIRASRQKRQVLVSIADTGSGIPPDDLPRIFDLFFTTKKPGAGTGLGLSICRKIIDAHGGTIRAESRPGEGTTVAILLPLS